MRLSAVLQVVRRHHLIGGAAVLYGVIDAGVVIAPAAVLRLDAVRSGASADYGRDLLVVSAVLAVAHAFVAWRRLAETAVAAARSVDVWIAALDALVVLAIAATGLVIAVLLGFAGLHTTLANQGWPVALLWAGLHVAALVLSEVVGRRVFRWLEPPSG